MYILSGSIVTLPAFQTLKVLTLVLLDSSGIVITPTSEGEIVFPTVIAERNLILEPRAINVVSNGPLNGVETHPTKLSLLSYSITHHCCKFGVPNVSFIVYSLPGMMLIKFFVRMLVSLALGAPVVELMPPLSHALGLSNDITS